MKRRFHHEVTKTRSRSSDEEALEIGRIVRRHGVRGELRLLPHNRDTTSLDTLPPVWLQGGPGAPQREARLTAARRHKGFILIRVAGVETADQAQALVGDRLLVPRAHLPPVEEGEIYHADLLGCRAFHTDGGEIGEIVDVFSTASNDVCTVRSAQGEVLIPLIHDVVRKIDTGGRRVVVEAVPGLLEP